MERYKCCVCGATGGFHWFTNPVTDEKVCGVCWPEVRDAIIAERAGEPCTCGDPRIKDGLCLDCLRRVPEKKIIEVRSYYESGGASDGWRGLRDDRGE